jgi:hypothetical protein
MTRIDLHPEELLDRAQSGAASADEQARLKTHLDVCSACRFEHALGADCRNSAEPQADDDIVMARIRASVTRALERRSYSGSRAGTGRRSRRWILLACAAILIVGTGGAATVIWRARSVAAEQAARVATRAAAPRDSIAKPTVPAPDPSPPEVANEAASRIPEPSAAIRKSSRPALDDSPKASSAAELFARANSLRRQNETAEALRVYRELQHAFPGSSEELVSRVTVGRLLLDRMGNASAALAEFDSYLARAPGGSLSEEAMIGRALTLGRLGRTAEEKSAWSTLLRAHPGSTYAARARDRIGQAAGK